MRKFLLSLIAAGVLIGGLSFVFIWHGHLPGLRLPRATTPAPHRQAPPVAVSVAIAKRQTVPIFLRGIGTVVAFNSVAIRARVDGNIVKVNFHEGQFVHKGDLLFELDPRPYQAALDQAVAKKAQDEAELANARVILARYRNLVKTNAVTQIQFDTQRATVAQLAAAVEADTAAVEAARTSLSYTRLTSPIDGITGIRQVDIGNLVLANSPQTLVLVTEVQPIYVQFTLPERTIPEIRKAIAQSKLRVFAFDGSDEHELAAGRLDLIDNSVDQSTGMVKARATFANKDEALWPGQFVNAHLVLKTVHNGITVPNAAVQTGPNGHFVYVVLPDSTVALHPVKVWQVENNVALLKSGVKAGDKVVVLGQSKLAPGLKVDVTSQAPTAAATHLPQAEMKAADPRSITPVRVGRGMRHAGSAQISAKQNFAIRARAHKPAASDGAQ